MRMWNVSPKLSVNEYRNTSKFSKQHFDSCRSIHSMALYFESKKRFA